MKFLILLGLCLTIMAEYRGFRRRHSNLRSYEEVDRLSREIDEMAQNITAYIYGTKETTYESKAFIVGELRGSLGVEKLTSIKNFIQLNYGEMLSKISRPRFGRDDDKKFEIFRELRDYEDQLVYLWFGHEFIDTGNPSMKDHLLSYSRDLIKFKKIFNSLDEFEEVKNRFLEVHGPLLNKKAGKNSFESILRRLNVRAAASIGPYASYEKKYRRKVIDDILDFFPEDEEKDRLRRKLEAYSTETLEEVEKSLGSKEYLK